MSLAERFKKLEGKKEKTDGCELIVRVAKYFGWSLSEVLSMKLPSFMVVLHTVTKIERAEKDGRPKNKNHR